MSSCAKMYGEKEEIEKAKLTKNVRGNRKHGKKVY